MVKTPKSKLQISNGKQSKVKFGAPASGASPSPLMPKKDYKKQSGTQDFGSPSFGDTGMTGES